MAIIYHIVILGRRLILLILEQQYLLCFNLLLGCLLYLHLQCRLRACVFILTASLCAQKSWRGGETVGFGDLHLILHLFRPRVVDVWQWCEWSLQARVLGRCSLMLQTLVIKHIVLRIRILLLRMWLLLIHHAGYLERWFQRHSFDRRHRESFLINYCYWLW